MLNFSPTFRALIPESPITRALQEVRRMTQRHLETGGVVKPADGRKGSQGFLVPVDIDPEALAAAIHSKLRGSTRTPLKQDSRKQDVLQRMPNGQLVVPQPVLERIGGGNADSGKRFLERWISEMRRRRADGRTT